MIPLIQIISEDRIKYLNDNERNELEKLERIKAASTDFPTAISLFQEVDLDGNNELDKNELKLLMQKIGLKVSDKRISEIMSRFDVDLGGKIDLNEFCMILKAHNREANARIKDILEKPLICEKSSLGIRFMPPESGKLNLLVVNGFLKKSKYRIMTNCDHEYMQDMMKTISGATIVPSVLSSLPGTKLRLEEGTSFATSMLQESPDKVAAIKSLIQRMNEFEDVQNLINTVINERSADLTRLKQELGALLRPLLGNPNGYYCLDLSKNLDRICLSKLFEISTTSAVERMEDSKIACGRVGDLSQKGNFESFRNEIFDGVSITLTSKFAYPTMPKKGILEFDFSSVIRPRKDVSVLSDNRVLKVLMNNGLLQNKDLGLAIIFLGESLTKSEKLLSTNRVNHFECSLSRAKEIARHAEAFHTNILHRAQQYRDSVKNEKSTAVDRNGNLIELFERDNSCPMAEMLLDYLKDDKVLTRETSKPFIVGDEMSLEDGGEISEFKADEFDESFNKSDVQVIDEKDGGSPLHSTASLQVCSNQFLVG